MNAGKTYVLVGLLIVFSLILTSCATPSTPLPPTPVPATQVLPTQPPTQVPPTKAAAATQVPPTQPPPPTAPPPTAAAKLQGPVPYPKGTELTGVATPKTFNLDEILQYKKLSKYCEPDWVTKLVADGKLPPVEKRLPDEPQVLLTSFMRDGVGEYGGVWRDYSGNPIDGWNWAAGQGSGWYGVNQVLEPALVEKGTMWLRKDKVEPLPSLAKSWEWSKDGTVLTMNLIRGAKWSDGHPFTTADIMFTWNDMILDPNVRSTTKRSSWQIDGKDINLEAVDDYTLKWTFPVPFPAYKIFDMGFNLFSPAPAHVLKPVHPKYKSGTDYKAFENSLPPNKLPVVGMGPWVPVSYKTDELLVMRRNPYYWKVDERGCQLPYLDEATWAKGTGSLPRTTGLMSGSFSTTNFQEPQIFMQVVKQAQDPNAAFRIEWGAETFGFVLNLNQSVNLGVKTDRDREVRKLFRDLRFRRAVSQAIDREGVARSISEGPFVRPYAGGIVPGSQFFDANSVIYYPYDLATSKALLAELGFKDTDNNGILNWTTGPVAGQDLALSLTSFDSETYMMNAEVLVPLLAKIGIKVNYRPGKQQVVMDQESSGEWDMIVRRVDQEFTVPNTRCNDLGPRTKVTPLWHREGTEPRQLQPFEQELVKVIDGFCKEPDSNKQKALAAQYNKIFTENIYNIGTITGRYGLGMSKLNKNVPIGAPAFLYEWSHSNFLIEQIWMAKKDQPPQTMPNQVPVYSQ